MNAYDRIYLEDVRTNVARMMDVAVYKEGYDISQFYDMFSSSEVAFHIENGSVRYLCGLSGFELARKVIEEKGQVFSGNQYNYSLNRSPEYWTGWAVSYYQWETGLKFSEIQELFSVRGILSMYPKYHEMDIRHFSDCLNDIYISKRETRLKMYREAIGLSQSGLSKVSGVPVRMIQQYEQRQKNINKAQADYVIRLSKALSVEPHILLEPVAR